MSPSFTFSSDPDRPAATVIRWLRSIAIPVLLTGGLAVVLGELAVRAFMYPTIRYRYDPVLGQTYRPSQKSMMWIGNYSYPTPPITINAVGTRGSEPNRTSRLVLALGSSEVLGPGLADEQTWSARLESLLSASERVVVLNGGHGGYGPFHHAEVMRRFLSTYDVDAALVRVSTGDRDFLHPSPPRLRHRLRELIVETSWFIPFALGKCRAQLAPIRQAAMPFFFRDRAEAPSPGAAGASMWKNNHAHWRQMLRDAERWAVPLVFVVFNPTGDPSNALLTDRLAEMVSKARFGSVLELGPLEFGLDAVPPEARAEAYRQELTLGFDPHANARQHALVAEALARFFHGSDLLRRRTGPVLPLQ